jgi:undecaprenyl-diphosphatase
LIEIGGNSFPSGHATATTALWLALALYAHLNFRRGWLVWPFALSVIALVASTRPYLGVHYATDVVAGALLSAAWVVVCLRVTGLARSREE